MDGISGGVDQSVGPAHRPRKNTAHEGRQNPEQFEKCDEILSGLHVLRLLENGGRIDDRPVAACRRLRHDFDLFGGRRIRAVDRPAIDGACRYLGEHFLDVAGKADLLIGIFCSSSRQWRLAGI